MSIPQLDILSEVPEGLLDCDARALHRVLRGPTLIELPGGEGAPLFVSALMHGNEDSGLGAIQRVLRAWQGQTLPRPLMLMIGNVLAAREGRRRLDGQPDFNRIWPGAEADQDTPEAAIMALVHARVIERHAFAAIDIHNNTGRNPYYGVVCERDDAVLGLAAMFAPRAVLFRGLPGTQTASFSGHVPAITVECGRPGSEENAAAAARLVDAVLSLEQLPTSPEGGRTMDLFHTLVQVRVKPEVALTRQRDGAWLELSAGLDALNFELAEPGSSFGLTNHPMPVEAVNEAGVDKAESYFRLEEGRLRLARPAIPAMLTSDQRIVRQDCLCYLMERLVGAG